MVAGFRATGMRCSIFANCFFGFPLFIPFRSHHRRVSPLFVSGKVKQGFKNFLSIRIITNAKRYKSICTNKKTAGTPRKNPISAVLRLSVPFARINKNLNALHILAGSRIDLDLVPLIYEKRYTRPPAGPHRLPPGLSAFCRRHPPRRRRAARRPGHLRVVRCRPCSEHSQPPHHP